MEIRLHPGFTGTELDVVRRLEGRRWDADKRLWTVPNPDESLTLLVGALGAKSVQVVREERAAESQSAAASTPAAASPTPADRMLDDVRAALTLRGYSGPTKKVYLGHLRRFLEWCDSGQLAALEGVESAGRAYIIDLLQRKNISRSYQNQVVSALRFFCEHVLGEPELALRFPRPRKERALPTVLSTREVGLMLARTRNLKHRALLMLVYSAGLRVGELVRLKPADLDTDRGLVRVHRGKGRKDRYSLLAGRAVEALKLYMDAYPCEVWLFPGAREDRHITVRSVQRVVKRAAKAAGIGKNVSTHTLRHSFATHLLEGGTNLRVIQELLGHQNSRTTQIYTHVARSTLEAVRSPLDNLP